MFGMSSQEFWEEDPQLYWAYRTFYLKKMELEQKEKFEYMKYDSWLKGNMNYIATSTSLNNAFSKTKHEFPKFDKVFNKDEEGEQKQLTKEEVNLRVQEEFNAWARY